MRAGVVLVPKLVHHKLVFPLSTPNLCGAVKIADAVSIRVLVLRQRHFGVHVFHGLDDARRKVRNYAGGGVLVSG